MKTRICPNCGQEKILTFFHICRSRPLGREYLCKECSNEKRRKRDRTKKRLLQVKKYQQSERGKKLRRLRQRRDYWLNRHKYTAKKLVKALLDTGEIKKGICAGCGSNKVLGHHPDYAKPLEVIWLCQRHHSEVHRTEHCPPL